MLYKRHRSPQSRPYLSQGFAYLRGNFNFPQPPEDSKFQGLPLRLRQLIEGLVKKHHTAINQTDLLGLG